MKIINNEPFGQDEINDIEVATMNPARIAERLLIEAKKVKPSISGKFARQELRIKTLCAELLKLRNVPKFLFSKIIEHFHPQSLEDFERLEKYLIIQIKIAKNGKFSPKNNYKNLRNLPKHI